MMDAGFPVFPLWSPPERFSALRGGRPIALFLHGWSADASVMAQAARRLSRRCQCIMLELPGHGAAEAAPESLDIRALCLRLAQLTDSIRPRSRPKIVIGWSLGAIIALGSAAMPESGADGLVLVGGTARMTRCEGFSHGPASVWLNTMASALRFTPAAVLSRFAAKNFSKDDRTLGSFPEADECLRRAVSSGDISAKRRLLVELGKADYRESVSDISVPARLLHGSADAIIPVGASHWLREHCGSAELEVVSGAGHALPLTRPDSIADTALELL